MPREIQNYFAKNQYKEFLKEEKIQSNKFQTLNLEGQF